MTPRRSGRLANRAPEAGLGTLETPSFSRTPRRTPEKVRTPSTLQSLSLPQWSDRPPRAFVRDVVPYGTIDVNDDLLLNPSKLRYVITFNLLLFFAILNNSCDTTQVVLGVLTFVVDAIYFSVSFRFLRLSRWSWWSCRGKRELAKKGQREVAAEADCIWKYVKNGDKSEILETVCKDMRVLHERGPEGETPLHLLFLFNNPQTLETAKIIGAHYPHLLTDVYEGETYNGENCLHIAIVNRNHDMVRFLLENGDPWGQLKAKAEGEFFKPGRPCYYGGTPLNFAVSTNQKELVGMLVKNFGIQVLEDTDTWGNNCLHMVAIHQLETMYDCLMELWKQHADDKRPALTQQENEEGLTPLSKAASLGYKEIFKHMLRDTAEPFWTYGPVSCVILPLEGLDYIPEVDVEEQDLQGPPKRDKGAMFQILKEGHVELLELPLIQELITVKWKKYAEEEFVKRFYWAIAYVLAFTMMVVVDAPLHSEHWSAKDWLHLALYWNCKIFTLFRAGKKLCVEGAEMRHQSLREYFGGVGGQVFENVVSLAFTSTYVVSQVLELSGYYFNSTALFQLGDGTLALSAVAAWIYLLWFLLGYQKTGHLVVMIWTILTGDMVIFGMVSGVFLVGFSVAFFVSLTEKQDRGVSVFMRQLMDCYHMMTSGGFEKDAYHESGSVLVSLFIAYSVLVTILLLNLLIAMMGNTFTQVNEQARKTWQLERARIIQSIDLELATSSSFKYYLNLYGKEEEKANRHILEIQEVQKERYLSHVIGNDRQ
ncbi:hypothetical protein CYMTET_24421 [Cymbomonas tetramitiformis]|uniref:Ion transport domain-containing protein n=1 Tax=Cymbomonas tetramitiformis TaxID=36881 RepID=A0AAE0FWL7_9CHLO|nr:hypothetical protein CYMTET_24421 [Cymbomonas tetramitiformis]